jgi:hypothetical protein
LIYGNEQIWSSLPAADLAELISEVDVVPGVRICAPQPDTA